MSDVTDAIQNLPPAGLIPIALLVVIGLVLWAAGGRVLRSGFAAAAFLGGGLLGWALGSHYDLGVTPWLPAIIVALVLACVAAAAYRLMLAASLGVVCAIAGPSAVVTVGEFQTARTDEAVAAQDAGSPKKAEPAVLPSKKIDDASDWLFPSKGDDGGGVHIDAGTIIAAKQDAEQIVGAGRLWWERTPEKLRPVVIGAAVTGGLAGLLIGTLAPTLTAVLVTGFGGSLVWLGGLRGLLARAGESVEAWLPATTAQIMLAWLVISIIGMAIQWTIRPKTADKPG